MRKIIYIDDKNDMGGGQYQLISLLKYLRHVTELNLVCIVDKNADKMIEHLRRLDITHYTLNLSHGYKTKVGWKKLWINIRQELVNFGSLIRSLFALDEIIRKEKPDLLCACTFRTALLFSVLSLFFKRCSSIYYVMNSRYFVDHGFFERFVFKIMDGFTFNSEYTKGTYDIVRGTKPYLINYSVVEPPYIDPDTSSATRIKMDAIRNGSDLLIGFVGSIVPRKRVEKFVEMANILISRGFSAKFILIGELGGKEYSSTLRKLTEKISAGNFLFTGHVDDIYTHISALDLLVLPSEGEGFGRVVIEAVMLNTPVVATSPGGVVEILEDVENCIVVERNDAQRLANAAEKILSVDGDRTPRTPSLFNDKFSIKNIVSREIEFYKKIILAKEKK